MTDGDEGLRMTVVHEYVIPNEMFCTKRELYRVSLDWLMRGRQVFPWWRPRYVRCWLGAKGWL